MTVLIVTLSCHLLSVKKMQYILKVIEIGAVMNFQKKNRRTV